MAHRDDALAILRIGGDGGWMPEALSPLLHAGGVAEWWLRPGAATAPHHLGEMLADADAEAAFAQYVPAAAASPAREGLTLREILYRHDITGIDLLLIHSAALLAPALAGVDVDGFRPALVHLSDPALSPAQRAGAAHWLRAAGYRIRPLPHGLLAENGGAQHAPTRPAEPGTAAELARFRALHAAGDLDGAERIAARLVSLLPGRLDLLQAALACNLGLGRARRAQRFARQVLPFAPAHPLAHLALVDGHAARGDRAAEEASRRHVAMAPAGALHPIRHLHDAHRALSLMLARPCDAQAARHAAELATMARAVGAERLAEESQRHWARHYRCLVMAADPALLAPGAAAAALGELPLRAGTGQRLGWAGLRRRPAWREAAVTFLVAADERYLRLYGRAYLGSVLRRADVACMVCVHVIGGAAKLPELAAELGVSDPRVFFTGDDFAAGGVTTLCHDSDGPRALPVAHFQSLRFAMAERMLLATGRPVIISDIDVLLQRGVADLLVAHQGVDVVLNRNAQSESFGSHITANLVLLMPSVGGRAFAHTLRSYLENALAGAEVSRWIDQCGLQMAWWQSAAQGTRFGWFDTMSDINNVIYPRWAPNPFRFLSLYHGFEMASLPGCEAA